MRAKSLASAAKTMEAEYSSVHCYHAQMEPMNCVARVAADGQSAEVWTGTQSTALAAFVASSVLKTTPDKIRVHQHLLGGGYGRRIWPDAVAQAVVLANITKEPVKLILTREDDLTAARPRPMTFHAMKAGLDGSGNLVAWHHRLVAENVDAVAAPPRFKATGGKDIIGWRGLEQPFYARAEHAVRSGARAARRAGARLARHRLGLQQVRRRSLPRRDRARHRQGSARHAPGADQGPSARPGGDQGRGRDGGLEEAAARKAARSASPSPTTTSRSAPASPRSRSIARRGKIKVHNYWIAGDRGHRGAAGERARAARKRGGLRPGLGADRGADVQGRRGAAVQLPRLPGARA